jgi:hypothetical protein
LSLTEFSTSGQKRRYQRPPRKEDEANRQHDDASRNPSAERAPKTIIANRQAGSIIEASKRAKKLNVR